MAIKKSSLKTGPQLNLDIQFGSDALEKRWGEIFKSQLLRKWLKASIQQKSTFTVRLVGSAESKRLNRDYRNKDYPTNILTFNYPTDDDSIWADLVICMPVINKEAKEQKKAMTDHFAHLLVHGSLHAQGFDHDDEIEAEGMESLEIAILSKLGIPNPYLSS